MYMLASEAFVGVEAKVMAWNSQVYNLRYKVGIE